MSGFAGCSAAVAYVSKGSESFRIQSGSGTTAVHSRSSGLDVLGPLWGPMPDVQNFYL